MFMNLSKTGSTFLANLPLIFPFSLPQALAARLTPQFLSPLIFGARKLIRILIFWSIHHLFLALLCGALAD